jgi:hypothetical protein
MSDTTNTGDARDRFREWDAAYVLGALSEAERAEFERHLTTCAECRAGVAELDALPPVMSRLSSEDALATIAPPADAAPSEPSTIAELATAVRRRRMRRSALWLAAAVVVVALATTGGVLAGTRIAQPAVTQAAGIDYTMVPATDPAFVTADVTVTSKAWGTRLDWSCDYAIDGEWPAEPVQYDMAVTLKDGATMTVASWTAAGRRAQGLSASMGVRTADIKSVQILYHATGKPLAGVDLTSR